MSPNGIIDRLGLLCASARIVPQAIDMISLTRTRAWGHRRDLLPALWRIWSRSPIHGRRQSRMMGWLESQLESGAQLTVGLPQLARRGNAAWLAPRLVWWPPGAVAINRPLVAVVSSRMGRVHRPAWHVALQQVCRQYASRDSILWSAAQTTTAAALQDIVQSSRQEMICLHLAAPRQTLGRWWTKLLTRSPSVSCGPLYPVELSPAWDPEVESSTVAQFPARDCAVIGAADHVIALYVRPRGYLEQLLRARLSSQVDESTSVRIALGSGLTPPETAQPILAAGALGWHFQEPRCERRFKPSGPSDSASAIGECRPIHDRQASVGGDLSVSPQAVPHQRAPIRPLPAAEDWSYLSHWTRGDSICMYSNAKYEGHGPSTALGILLRIVGERRLQGSAQAIRGGSRVVCFTAIPLADWPQRRRFRPHRGRWDFEPYGICIRRTWLQRQGVRPVRYGDDRFWAGLDRAEHPFFQYRCDLSTFDWSSEHEWRHVGDLDLSDLGPADAFVFAPADALPTLRRESPWPVCIMPTRPPRP